MPRLKDFFIHSLQTKPRLFSHLSHFYNTAVALLLFFLLALNLSLLDYQWNWGAVWEYRGLFAQGLRNTMIISFLALGLSLLIGILLLMLLESRIYVLNALGRFWIEILQGTPLIVQILILYYVVLADIFTSRYIPGIIILAISYSIYIAQILQSSLKSIEPFQFETARMLGLPPLVTARYILLPQFFSQAIPALTGQFTSLIRNSSLLSYIAVAELTIVSRQFNSNTFSSFEGFIVMAAGYLLINYPLSRLTRFLEKRWSYRLAV